MFPLIILGLSTLGFGFALSSLVGGIARGGEGARDISRKVFHIGIFTGAVPAQLLVGFWGIVTYGAVISLLVLFSWWQGPGSSLNDALSRPTGNTASREARGSILTPLISTALGGLLSTLLMGEFAIAGYLVCGWGDAVGEPVGKRWGRRTYPVPFSGRERTVRSLEGSAGVFLVGSLGGGVALLLLGSPLLAALGIGLACGLVGAVSEGLSSSGTDNFWVQLLPTLTAWWLMG